MLKKSKCAQRRYTGTLIGKILPLIVLIAAVPVLSGCGSHEGLELVGTLERRTLEASAPISEIIVQLPVKEGDRVEKGTIIVQLDTEVVAAELRAHQAALSAAQALLKEASGEFARQRRLTSMKVATTQAFDIAKRKRDEAVALVAEKEARIAQAKKRLADLTIRANASGLLDQLPYETGERVPAGGVVAVVMADDKPWVRVWLPARVVARVKLNQQAKIKVHGLEQWFTGNVEYISREPEFTPHYALTEKESAHLVYETKIRLDTPKKDLPAGIPVRVKLAMAKK